MRQETLDIFGKPIPTGLLELARRVDQAIENALGSTELADRNKALKRANEIKDEQIADLTWLRKRNVGGHFYPGITRDAVCYSKCDYCDCTMAGSTSSAPPGQDQFGECVGNQMLRVNAEKLSRQLCEIESIVDSHIAIGTDDPSELLRKLNSALGRNSSKHTSPTGVTMQDRGFDDLKKALD